MADVSAEKSQRDFFDGIYPAPPDNFDPVCFHKRYAAAYRS